MAPDTNQMRRVLRRLARAYPNVVEISTIPEIDTPDGHRTLFYLEEKRYVERGSVSERPGQAREMLAARATAKGLDWLKKGVDPTPLLSSSPAELEALREFLSQSIQSSDLHTEIKQPAVARLHGLSAEELKALHLRLLRSLAEKPEMIVEAISRSGQQR